MNNQTKHFFEVLYRDIPAGYISVWDRQSKQTRFYQSGEWDDLSLDVARRVAECKDVYFGVCPYENALARGRGSEQDVIALPALYMDVDVAEGTHSSGKQYPENVDIALTLLQGVLKPSIVVFSGGGLHLYWLLATPLKIEDNAQRISAKQLLRDFQMRIIKLFETHGYSADNTSDLARVLRVPGTINFKNAQLPQSVQIVHPQEAVEDQPLDRYDIEMIREFIGVSQERSPASKGVIKSTQDNGLLDGDVAVTSKRCSFIRHCIDDAAQLGEHPWYAAIANLALAKDADAFIHTMSRPHPGYSREETDAKISHARTEQKPHTCRYIQNDLGFKGCPDGNCPVEAPIGWLSRKGVAYDTIFMLLDRDKLTRNDIWADKAQDALVEIKINNVGDYLSFLLQLRDKVPDLGVNNLKASINDRARRKTQQRPASGTHVIAELSEQLGYDVSLPPGYYFDGEGQLIHQCGMRLDSVAMQPIGLGLQFVGNEDQRLSQIVYQTHGQGHGWRKLLVMPKVLASVTGILELANYGVLVDSTNSAQLVNYLTKYNKVNGRKMPVVPFTSHFGWQSDGSFFPGLSEHRFIRYGGVVDETARFQPQGTLEEWTRIAEPARQSAGARLALAVSFAAPILKLVKCRTFVVHIWGPSRGGKTAAQVLAGSVWLNPEKAMISFNTTKVGLERQLGCFTNLPMIIDERQVIGDNQGLLDTLVYMVGEGQGRIRGNKIGSLQRTESWNTIALTSGEHPLSSQSSAGGVKTRLLEPFFEKVVDDAARLHIECGKNYGVAGPVFLKQIIQSEGIITDAIEYWSSYLRDKITGINEAHQGYLTVIAATDYLVSKLIWNMADGDAMTETKIFLDAWKKALDTNGDTEEVDRMRAFVEGWLAQHECNFSEVTQFADTVSGQRYGWYFSGGNIGILPTAFSKALTSNGFHWDRLKIDFAKQGWLKTGNDRGNISYTVTRAIPGTGTVRVVELIDFRKIEKDEIQGPLVQGDPIKFTEDGDILN